MTNEEKWNEKALAFEEFYYKKIGRKDPVRLWQNYQEAKMTALTSILASEQPFTKELFYEVCCSALDNLSTNWHKIPILSEIEIKPEE